MTRGTQQHRYKQNPEEKRFADAWEKEQSCLRYILSTRPNNKPIDPAERDRVVVATVIQWLGSPVGQDFLVRLGYRRDKNVLPETPGTDPFDYE